MFTAGQIKMKLTKSKLREVIKEVMDDLYRDRSDNPEMTNLFQLISSLETTARKSAAEQIGPAIEEFEMLKTKYRNIIKNNKYLNRSQRSLGILLGGLQTGQFRVGPGHSNYLRTWLNILADSIEGEGS